MIWNLYKGFRQQHLIIFGSVTLQLQQLATAIRLTLLITVYKLQRARVIKGAFNSSLPFVVQLIYAYGLANCSPVLYHNGTSYRHGYL